MNKQQLLELFPLGNPDGRDAQRRERMDPISAISIGLPIVSNLIGGVKGAKTATSAAQGQADSAIAAGKKVEGAAADTRGAILESAKNAGGAVTSAAGAAGAGVASAADRSNALLDPYRTAGDESTEALRSGLMEGGQFNKMPSMADIQIDPGYAWRVAEVQKAMERGAAARGTVQSGGFAVDLNRKIQGEGSQEYQNAFDRYRQSTGDRFSRLSSLSSFGKDAASEQGANLRGSALYGGNVSIDSSKWAGGADIDANNRVAGNTNDAARIAAGYNTDAANAIAAGKVARTNAITGAITGATNGVTGALQFREALKNPAFSYIPTGTRPTMPSSAWPSTAVTAPPFVPPYPRRA